MDAVVEILYFVDTNTEIETVREKMKACLVNWSKYMRCNDVMLPVIAVGLLLR